MLATPTRLALTRHVTFGSEKVMSAPNPRLQRTRSASPPSPLSRQSLGDRANRWCRPVIAGWLAWAAILSGCTTTPLTASRATSAEEEAEVVGLARLAKDYHHLGTVFLCVDQANPSPVVLDRVVRLSGVRALPCKSQGVNPDPWGGPLDPGTGGRGIAISVSKVHRVTSSDYEMSGGYYCGGLCAAAFSIRVRHDEAGWQLFWIGMQWIS